MTMGYGEAAQRYWDLGWHGVLPLPPGRKKPVPKGYTGYDGVYPKFPDVFAWAEEFPDGNVGLRMPDNVIGLDVDSYNGKTGGATYNRAVKLWGTLPPTWMSTSRSDGMSGIRMYRVPPGTRLITQLGFADEGIGHVEIVQRVHRYAVVAPSIHPDTGKEYRWADPEGYWAEEWPAVEDLPELPQRWLEALTETGDADVADVDVAEVLRALPAGPMNPWVRERTDQAIADLAAKKDSRHDTTTRHVLALLRLAETGREGVAQALKELGKAFVAAVAPDRGEGEAKSEYTRMVVGKRGHGLIAATPTVDIAAISGVAKEQWQLAGAQAPQEPPATPEPSVTVVEPPAEPPAPPESPFADFWEERASLRTIRTFAYSRMCSPWSVLGVVMARALTMVPPWITLPPLIGGRGSLNTFIALVGPSGGGKGASESAAGELLPAKIHIAPLGSGEGIAHQYAHYDTKDKQIVWDRTAVMFSESEIDTLAGISARTGSTLMGKIRNAFSGEEIGFSYADSSRRITLGRHEYRLTLVLGVQPTRAATLIGDAHGGTPQRFVWMPTVDPGISINPPASPPSIVLRPQWDSYARSVAVPGVARHEILDNHVRRARGEGDALDGHSLFTRLKVATALAILDGRIDINEEDWELSATVMEVSDETRELCTKEIRRAEKEENQQRGEALGVQRAVADAVAEEAKVARVAGWIVRKLGELGGGASWSRLHRRMANRDREYLEPALMRLAEDVRITVTEDREIRLYEASQAGAA
jgi:hypothetical protein